MSTALGPRWRSLGCPPPMMAATAALGRQWKAQGVNLNAAGLAPLRALRALRGRLSRAEIGAYTVGRDQRKIVHPVLYFTNGTVEPPFSASCGKKPNGKLEQSTAALWSDLVVHVGLWAQAIDLKDPVGHLSQVLPLEVEMLGVGSEEHRATSRFK